MKAVRHIGYHTFPEFKDVDKPTPGPGEVLLKVAGAGACHSDVAIFHEFDEGLNPQMDPEFTLGHENTGWAEELGEGVAGIELGAAYLVYGPVGCGICRACTRGQDTYCENAAEMDYAGIGLGRDGGMAEYVVVPARNLVPLGDADPINAAPLADAALTPYHAIKLALPHLNGGGKYALVIGLGGLGLIGVQILKALTGATIIATDMKEDAMAQAEKRGAIPVAGGEGQVERIREITGGNGVNAAFDFVGIGATVTTAMRSVARQGRVTIVGIGNQSPYEWAFLSTPYEAELVNTYWGTVEELHEVVDMYKAGQIEPQVTTYPLDKALEAYQALVDGEISGRAVIVPHAE
ncbi:NAD(P)-dependent alcohol dehydrogenase [Corynebacterium sanguinis]|uniref:NAD(P)-dependent alcohol dehydrogenase n=1 Tax=Corynebacterium sanguinis TaxID=2594913 RepID=UPI0011A65B04|nr:NAD(P)-dependent alcohol dehydrogenase [Corynebacterium sanguinis]MCT1464465.1 NAD(P)-dependent alcohol dehydrogenase [Corynebacterium sanguinis]MCT1499434.1 NAD(P)-dependent alcohol dehydrogenase [Corynebacterium sanguinis]MCT1883272.1 NAD(P)-dependent alcohol dehydrogenase [Corynebacterium sanguinis]MCT2330446.1 NAD(P)-dependent alcohol dehydrogenase [Corynebacterium sanguinis]TVS23265.1 NAD(P)-dependent alcohol dehydrogenase [Corynebacterium sanguinis]